MNCLEFSSYEVEIRILLTVAAIVVVMLVAKILAVEEDLAYDVVESAKAFSFFKKFFQCKY